MSTPTPPDETFPGDTPIPVPNVQTSAHYPPGYYATSGFSDRDNFVTDSATFCDPAYAWGTWWWGWPVTPSDPVPPVTQPPSASGRTPVLSLQQIKLWLRIEPSQTDEDTELVMMECAARLFTEQYARITLDPDAQDADGNPIGVGENVQQAMLLLIAEWYAHRELMVSGRLAEVPYGYAALMSTVRDYPVY